MATKTLTTLAADMRRLYDPNNVGKPYAPAYYSLRDGLEVTVPMAHPSDHPSYDRSPDPEAARELAGWASNWSENSNAMSWDDGHVAWFYRIVYSPLTWRQLNQSDRQKLTESELEHVRSLHTRAGGVPSVEDWELFVLDSEYAPETYVRVTDTTLRDSLLTMLRKSKP